MRKILLKASSVSLQLIRYKEVFISIESTELIEKYLCSKVIL
jgi:hypothetical protein